MDNQVSLLREAVPLLLRWYASNKRNMPWRDDPTPYRVWVSEIMLQQTRVEAVVPYYLRFMRELPSVEALAAVPEERLMKLWEGLGYYSRARNLRKTAVLLCERYGGELPQSAEELRALPGIGDYTAGAISSIAYLRAEPAVDGNVLRVVTRLAACGDDAARDGLKKEVAAQLREVYPAGNDASSLTQALMELGEAVCIPNGAPLCGECPVRTLCRAHAKGEEEAYPVRAPKKQRREERLTVLLLFCGGKVAVRKRTAKGLLSGLWEFPNFAEVCGEEEIAERLRAFGVQATKISPCGRSRHVFTHIEWDMRWFAVQCAEQSEGFVWADANELSDVYALPTAFRHYKKCGVI